MNIKARFRPQIGDLLPRPGRPQTILPQASGCRGATARGTGMEPAAALGQEKCGLLPAGTGYGPCDARRGAQPGFVWLPRGTTARLQRRCDCCGRGVVSVRTRVGTERRGFRVLAAGFDDRFEEGLARIRAAQPGLREPPTRSDCARRIGGASPSSHLSSKISDSNARSSSASRSGASPWKRPRCPSRNLRA